MIFLLFLSNSGASRADEFFGGDFLSGPQCKYGKAGAFDFLVLPLTLRRIMSGGDVTTASKNPRIFWLLFQGSPSQSLYQ